MDECSLLLEKAESKLNSAKVLFEKGIYDDAISRAYYSMFYAAKALLCLKNKHPRTHRGVVHQFGLEFVKSGVIEEYYAKALITAQERRERSDYDIYYKPSKEEAEDIIEDAEKFLEKAKIVMKDVFSQL